MKLIAILVEFFRLKVRFVRTGTTDFNSNFSARWRDILFRNSFLHIRTVLTLLLEMNPCRGLSAKFHTGSRLFWTLLSWMEADKTRHLPCILNEAADNQVLSLAVHSGSGFYQEKTSACWTSESSTIWFNASCSAQFILSWTTMSWQVFERISYIAVRCTKLYGFCPFTPGKNVFSSSGLQGIWTSLPSIANKR